MDKDDTQHKSFKSMLANQSNPWKPMPQEVYQALKPIWKGGQTVSWEHNSKNFFPQAYIVKNSSCKMVESFYDMAHCQNLSHSKLSDHFWKVKKSQKILQSSQPARVSGGYTLWTPHCRGYVEELANFVFRNPIFWLHALLSSFNNNEHGPISDAKSSSRFMSMVETYTVGQLIC